MSSKRSSVICLIKIIFEIWDVVEFSFYETELVTSLVKGVNGCYLE
jgi:hypothetical protein